MSNLATIEFYWSYLREYRWGLLTGVKVTQTAVSPKPDPAWMCAHQCWKSGAHCTARRQPNRLGSVLSRWLCQSEPLSGSLASHGVIFPTWLVWEWLPADFTVYILRERQDLVNLVTFRNFLKLTGLLPVIKSFSAVFHFPLDLLFNLVNILFQVPTPKWLHSEHTA